MQLSHTLAPKMNCATRPGLIAICGPTATGKSGLALALAQALGSTILSADSRQVYRHFDIGTAKPSAAEQQLVPHYLIDCCEPTETLTLGDYQLQAQERIAALHQSFACPIPLLVGGTGLYLCSVVQGLKIPRVPPHPELRSQLQVLGQTQCYAWLQQVDEVAAAKIHANDQVRTLRALEVFYTTGRPISEQQGEQPPAYPILQIGLDCSEANNLTQRIRDRTHRMVELGWETEVRTLCQTYGSDLPLLDTLGYREMKQYLQGDCNLTQAIEQTVVRTRQFAKQQRTWFRKDARIEWFDADSPTLRSQVWQRVEQFLLHCRQSTD